MSTWLMPNIPGGVLRWADQLARMLMDIFNTFPVTKTSTIMCFNAALTPIMMKCFERLVKDHTISSLPPYSAPSRTRITSHEFGTSGVEDHVRMLLVNLSSAFNTIIPQQQPVLQRGGEAEEMIIESLHSSLKTALHQVSGGGDS